MGRLFLLVAVLTASWASWAIDPQSLEDVIHFPVEKYQLKNGLTVLLQPDSTIPEVSVQQWFRVGSKDEEPGHTGLAHFFEHMMFKGTKKFPRDTWGKYLNNKGADLNAFTTNDYTGFYINAPSENLELLLQIESDRMRNLNLDPKDVNSEREVVKEERRLHYDDSVEGGIREKMAEIMFVHLPYHWLPIGSMTDLNAATMDDLRSFYKSYYSPNNAVLVVGGSFQPSDAKKLIETYYNALPAEEIHRPTIKPEDEQKSARRATIEREVQAATVAIGYRLPDVHSNDHYALDLLSTILGQGESSRLHKQLVYKRELAIGVSAASWDEALAGEFSIGASLKPKVDPEKAIKLIEDEVKTLRDKAVSAKELAKARNLFMKEYVDGLKRVSSRARDLADYEIVYGDYTRIFTDLKKYQQVTEDDIKRVAKLYLQPYQRNIVVVAPRKAGGST